jgi:hypothetical protein
MSDGIGAPAAPKVLPPEYRTLAENLSLDIKPSPDQYRDNKSITQIIAEGHGAVMALRGIQSPDRDITYIAEQGRSAYSEAIGRLERINALPKPPGAGELFLGSFIDGFFYNFGGAYERGRDAEEKQRALVVEFEALSAAVERGDAAHQLLPKVAENYSAPLSQSSARIVVDFDEAWAWWGPHDWLSIYNNGPALQDCTIVVELTGGQRETRKNVHFTRNWLANTWMYARYQPGQEVLGRRVGNTTVNNVQKLDVTVYSPQFATKVNYVYQGAVKDSKIAEKCKNLRLSGRYQPFQSGVFSDTQRGACFTLDGVPFIGKCRVDATFHPFGLHEQPKSAVWEFDSWKKGEEKILETQKGQLTSAPIGIDVVISFPGTGYRYKANFMPDHFNHSNNLKQIPVQ